MKVLLTATVQSHICQFHKPLVEVLHEHGYEVHVAARDNLAEKNGLKLDFVEKVYDVPFARSPKSKDNLRAYKELKRIIDCGQYDVVHCNTPMGGIVTRLAARNARTQGTKVYYTAHGFHFYKGAPKKNWLVFYPIEKFFSRMTDKLITITQEDYKLASKKFHCEVEHIHGVGVDEERYLSIEEKEIEKMKEENECVNRTILLCVGELNKNKNQKTIIKALSILVKKYSNILLLLAGNGSEKEMLEKQIAEYGLKDNVEMLGYRTDLEKYINMCDILVSASCREGLPMNIMEAMVCKKVIVASENRGHKELIQNGISGVLVDSQDYKAYAKEISGLIENTKVAEKMVEASWRNVQPYMKNNVKVELEKIYEMQ